MNQQGKAYVAKANHAFNALRKQHSEIPKQLSNEQIYERMMRLGREVKVYEVEEIDMWDFAIASIRADIVRRYATVSSQEK